MPSSTRAPAGLAHAKWTARGLFPLSRSPAFSLTRIGTILPEAKWKPDAPRLQVCGPPNVAVRLRAPPTHRGLLWLLNVAHFRRLDEGEQHDLFAGHGTYVVVQAQCLHASNLFHHCFPERPHRFDQMGPDLLEKAPALAPAGASWPAAARPPSRPRGVGPRGSRRSSGLGCPWVSGPCAPAQSE